MSVNVQISILRRLLRCPDRSRCGRCDPRPMSCRRYPHSRSRDTPVPTSISLCRPMRTGTTCCGLLDMPRTAGISAPNRTRLGHNGIRRSHGRHSHRLTAAPRSTTTSTVPRSLTFTRSHDLFGDGSVVLVDLAGHTPGSVGVLLHTSAGRVLLAGDAAWHTSQVEDIRQKSSYPGGLADEDRAESFDPAPRLHAIKDRVTVVPTHDPDAAKWLQAGQIGVTPSSPAP